MLRSIIDLALNCHCCFLLQMALFWIVRKKAEVAKRFESCGKNVFENIYGKVLHKNRPHVLHDCMHKNAKHTKYAICTVRPPKRKLFSAFCLNELSTQNLPDGASQPAIITRTSTLFVLYSLPFRSCPHGLFLIEYTLFINCIALSSFRVTE